MKSLGFSSLIRGLTVAVMLLTGAPGQSAPDRSADGLAWLEITKLRPTQFAVGHRVVEDKAEEIYAMSKDERHEYLAKNFVPVVLGPGGEMYMVDRHHLTRAIIENELSRIYVKVIDDLSALDEAAFWQVMQARNYVYLFDQEGRSRPPQELPRYVSRLPDDVFRSLAEYVQREGGYKKTDENFAEMKWAAFFRSRIPRSRIDDDWKDSVELAVAMARMPDADGLPGYLGVRRCSSLFN